MKNRIQWILALGMVASASPALAQNPYDPPTSVRPPPNVMLLMDATGTTRINGSTCRGSCHVEGPTPGSCGGWGGEWDCNIYAAGQTRLQLARRVLTGGWGWNTAHVDGPGPGTNGPADAQLRTDGVMDQYKVRWGVTWYDGIGTHLAIDPTADNLLAQKAVIDFGHPGRNEATFKTGAATPSARRAPHHRRAKPSMMLRRARVSRPVQTSWRSAPARTRDWPPPVASTKRVWQATIRTGENIRQAKRSSKRSRPR